MRKENDYTFEENLWASKLAGSSIQVLYTLECFGLPDNPRARRMILARLRDLREDDYQVREEDLKQYYPGLFEEA
jgi:hypothetical protein